MAEPTKPLQPLPSAVDGVTVRQARPSDTSVLVDLVERCSELTLHRRFHGATGPHVQREVRRIASPTPEHRSWVVVGPGGDVRGTATLAWGRAGDVHVAFLVDDAWQRRGVGRSLYRALAREAVAAGLPAVTATVQGDNVPALRFLHVMAPDARSRFVDGEVEVRVPVASAAHGRPGARPPTPSPSAGSASTREVAA